MRRVWCALATALQLAAIGGPSLAADVSDNRVVSSSDDAALAAASSQARKTLPIFWKKYDQQTSPYYGVYASFPVPGGVENVWARPLRREHGKVLVRIAADPASLKLKYGDQVWIEQGQIIDWQYASGGKLYGAYVTRALMSRVTSERRETAARLLAPTPLEPGDN